MENSKTSTTSLNLLFTEVVALHYNTQKENVKFSFDKPNKPYLICYYVEKMRSKVLQNNTTLAQGKLKVSYYDRCNNLQIDNLIVKAQIDREKRLTSYKCVNKAYEEKEIEENFRPYISEEKEF